MTLLHAVVTCPAPHETAWSLITSKAHTVAEVFWDLVLAFPEAALLTVWRRRHDRKVHHIDHTTTEPLEAASV